VEHVVFYTAADGSPAYRRTANLEDAVRVVEHLRNVEGVEDVHVYALESVALSFRPYYRVEVAPGAPPAQAHQPQHMAVPAAPAPALVEAAVEAAALEAAAAEAVPQQFEPFAPPAPAEPVFAQASVPAPVEVAPEPVPALSIVAPPAAEHAPEDPASNGRGGRGLGFFTR
jgi:hypothetical protein